MSFFTKEVVRTKYGESYKERCPNIPRILLAAILALFLLVTFLNAFTIIKTGYSGVKITCGQIDDVTLDAGPHFKIPYFQKIVKVNNKQQDIQFAEETQIWAETKEKVPLSMSNVTVTYQIESGRSAWLYANVTDYTKNLVSNSIVSSALKDAAVQFTAEEVTTRANIESRAEQCLQEALDAKYGADTVRVANIVISNMDFEASYNDAINRRSLAQKEQETQEISNKTAIAKAEADAQVKLTQTKAEADATVVKAQGEADAMTVVAEAQASANKMLAESVTPALIDYEKIQKWNGELPMVSGSANQIVGIDTSSFE